MSEPNDLMPCPFCGAEAFLYGLEGELIKCETCESEAPVEAWNRRANRWSAFEDEELSLLRPNYQANKTWTCELLHRELDAELARRAAKGGR